MILGVRGKLGLLNCAVEDGVYCLALQGNAEHHGWLGGGQRNLDLDGLRRAGHL